MQGLRLLQIAAAFLCIWFALSSALRVVAAVARLQQANSAGPEHTVAYLLGACAGVVLWGALSFYLLRGAAEKRKTACETYLGVLHRIHRCSASLCAVFLLFRTRVSIQQITGGVFCYVPAA